MGLIIYNLISFEKTLYIIFDIDVSGKFIITQVDAIIGVGIYWTQKLTKYYVLKYVIIVIICQKVDIYNGCV